MTVTASPIEVVCDDHFDVDVLEADRPVLVDFTAAWCPPCRAMKPVLAEIAAARPDVRVVHVDVDSSPAAAARYEVLSMPTFVLFRGGVPVMRVIGARPRRRLERELSDALGA
jgi:thioredoxin 1